MVRVLTFLSGQASINEVRRRRLADVAQEAENAWRRANPKEKPPEKHLFVPGLRSVKKIRKWKLVPVVKFND